MKTTLASHLRQVMKRRGITNDRLASLIGEEPPSVRSWFNRNKFPPEVAEEMVRIGLIEGPATDLPKQYSFDWVRPTLKHGMPVAEAKLDRVFRKLDLHAKQLERTQNDFELIVADLFSALSAGDIFWYLALEQAPIEWSRAGWEKVGPKICDAVVAGANLVYLVPEVDVFDRAREEGLRVAAARWWDDFDVFLGWIVAAVEKREVTRSMVEKQVRRVSCKRSFFQMPMMKVALFFCNHSRSYRAFASFKAESNSWLSLPLHKDFTEHNLTEYVRLMEAKKATA